MRRAAAVVGASPDFVVAGAALVTWVDPSVLGEDKVSWFLGLMLLEFIVVHSSAFLGAVAFGSGSRPRKLIKMTGLSLFYSLFAAAFAATIGESWPFWVFWGLTANRMLGVTLGAAPAHHEREYIQTMWAISGVSYLTAAFLTLLLPIPALGVTPEMLGVALENSSGVWVDAPHRLIAFAFVYFTAQGIFGLFATGGEGEAQAHEEA
jgi:hypothetical protein